MSIETLVEGVTTGRLSRRGFLQGAVALGLSMSGAVALLEACTSGTQGTSKADLTFVVWSYGVETIRDNIKKLEAKVSGRCASVQWNTTLPTRCGPEGRRSWGTRAASSATPPARMPSTRAARPTTRTTRRERARR